MAVPAEEPGPRGRDQEVPGQARDSQREEASHGPGDHRLLPLWLLAAGDGRDLLAVVPWPERAVGVRGAVQCRDRGVCGARGLYLCHPDDGREPAALWWVGFAAGCGRTGGHGGGGGCRGNHRRHLHPAARRLPGDRDDRDCRDHQAGPEERDRRHQRPARHQQDPADMGAFLRDPLHGKLADVVVRHAGRVGRLFRQLAELVVAAVLRRHGAGIRRHRLPRAWSAPG